MSVEIANVLRRSGHDAQTVRDAGLLGQDDSLLLGYATGQGRVLLTADYGDFYRLSLEWNAVGREFPGIVLVRLPKSAYSISEMVARIEQHITADPDRLENSLTWLPPLLS
jgi:predicted nuclease of predicted toxin-antitoxin system